MLVFSRCKLIYLIVLLCFLPCLRAAQKQPKLNKPQLVIIMDDMINQRQLTQAQSLNLTLNYAFIPPTAQHPHSATIANQLDEYLIHLPLEAINYHKPEIGTLSYQDSAVVIQQRVQQIKQLFPKANYVNNHTGSRFTADTGAMQKLLQSLQQANLRFIDSRTTHKTVASQVAQQIGMPLLSRDVFLDHSDNPHHIVAAIKQAIRLAKQQGTAIAIAHPRPNTFAVMRQYRHLFNDVELITVRQLVSPQKQGGVGSVSHREMQPDAL